MKHAINFVDDCELPEGQDFLFIAHPDGAMIFYRENAVTPTVLEDSWAAYRASWSGDGRTPTRIIPREQRPVLTLVATG